VSSKSPISSFIFFGAFGISLGLIEYFAGFRPIPFDFNFWGEVPGKNIE